MEKDKLITLLLVAIVVVSAIQIYQVMAFQSVVNTLLTVGASVGTLGGASASAATQSGSSGVGSC